MQNDKMMKTLMIIFSLLFSLGALADDDGRMFLKKANEHYAAGRYDVAVGYYLKAAEFDETEAQFNLGYALYHGEGITQDYPSAVMWFKRAARKQYPKAEYNLAFCYMYGKGVPCNYEKAQQLLVSAAKHGLTEAQITLSECYEHGILVEQDLSESKRWKDLAERMELSIMNDTVIENSAPPTFDILLDGKQQKNSEVISTSQKKAPVIKILFPVDQSLFHTNVVKLRYQLIADGLEKSTKVVAMVDAEKIDPNENRAVKQANVIEIDVPNRDCTITLYAQNEAGNSEPVSIRLIRENVAQGNLPHLFCVAVGVGDYHEEKLPPLKLATKDASDFAKVVEMKRGLPFCDVQVKVLTDKEATREDIFEALEWLQKESSPNDICLFFYAGHGYRDEKDRFYFMPYGGTTDKLYKCFSSADFKNMADDINGKLIVFADACYSAALFEGSRSAATTHFLEQLRSAKNGMMLYASSASDTKSKEDPAWGNGAFTKALISAFNGGARQQFDEGLSTQVLEMYLYKEVRRLTNFKQTPIFINPNGIEHFNIFTYEN